MFFKINTILVIFILFIACILSSSIFSELNSILWKDENFHYIIEICIIFIIIYIMDYNKDNIAKDKAQTWKNFNKLTIYTLILVAIVLIIIFSLFNY